MLISVRCSVVAPACTTLLALLRMGVYFLVFFLITYRSLHREKYIPQGFPVLVAYAFNDIGRKRINAKMYTNPFG